MLKMNCVFIKKDEDKQHPPLNLRYIWMVDEGLNYDIQAGYTRPEYTVAVRTIHGAGKIITAAGEYEAAENTVLILRRGELIRYKTLRPNWYFYWFEFTPAEKIGRIFKTLPVTEAELAVLKDIAYSASFHPSVAETGFAYLMEKWTTPAGEKTASSLAEEVARHIDSLPAGAPYDISSFLIRHSISERTLRKRFREVYGVSPVAYSRKKKIETIKILLQTTKMNMREIAEYTGFDNEYYFSRFVRQTLGFPPAEYRKQHEK